MGFRSHGRNDDGPLVGGGSSEGPTCPIVDDVGWLDPQSLVIDGARGASPEVPEVL